MPLRIHDDTLSRRVGAIVLVVTAAVIVYVIGFRERFPEHGVDIRVYFAQSTGIREGAVVRIAGRDIGVVTSISIVPASRTWKGHPLEGIGGVAVVARLDPSWAARIPVSSELFVGSRSILSPRYLEIAAPRDPAPCRTIRDKDELRGVDPPDLDRVLQRVWNNLEDIQAFTESINPAIAALHVRTAQLRFTISRVVPEMPDIQPAIAEAERLAAAVEPAVGSPVADHARAFFDRASGQIASLRGQIDALKLAIERAGDAVPPDLRARIDSAIATIDPILRQTDALLANIDGVIADAVSGPGAIAAFSRDLELIDDVKEMTKMMKRHPWRVVIPNR